MTCRLPALMYASGHLVFLLLAGCENPRNGAVADRGSSVSSDTVVSAPPYPEWNLSQDALILGDSFEGPEHEQFSDIRFLAGPADGFVVMFDGGTSEIRGFLEDGSLSFRIGGTGEGPSEFGYVISGAFHGESVSFLDWRNGRVAWFGLDGGLLDTRRVEVPSLSSSIHPLGPEEVVLVLERPVFAMGNEAYNYTRDSLTIVVAGREQQTTDTLLVLPGREAVTWIDFGPDGRAQGTRQMELPFGYVTLVTTLNDSTLVVAKGDGELTLRDRSGTIRVVSRSEQPAALSSISEALRRRYTQVVSDAAVANGAQLSIAVDDARRRLDLLEPDHGVPAYDRLLADRGSQRVWVRQFMVPGSDPAVETWTVFGDDARVLAQVGLPDRVELMHVLDGRLLAVRRDSVGLESIVTYRIVTPRSE